MSVRARACVRVFCFFGFVCSYLYIDVCVYEHMRLYVCRLCMGTHAYVHM